MSGVAQQARSERRFVAANDFARQWADTRSDVLGAVERVGQSGWLVLGDEVQRFERELAQWWRVPYAVGVASGLDAIEIILRAAGIGRGDRVLTTPLTAFATTLAIVRAGAEPVWVDVDESGGLDLDLALGACERDATIRALVPVHLYGHPLDPERLAEFGHRGIIVVEDCAQAAGASRRGSCTGLVGVGAAVSLYPTKNLGAMGDGGVVLTTDGELAERARRLRNYGEAGRYEHVELGLNSRLDELQAAILRDALLPRLSGWIERRRAIAARYVAELQDTWLRPIVPTGGTSACHLFPVEVTSGDPRDVAAHLRDEGIGVGRHYPVLCPDQPAIDGRGHRVGELQVARRLAARELSLPIHPYLHEDEIDHVIAACRSLSQ